MGFDARPLEFRVKELEEEIYKIKEKIESQDKEISKLKGEDLRGLTKKEMDEYLSKKV